MKLSPYVEYLILLILVTGFGSAGYQRNVVWKNEVSLWRDIVNKSPNKYRPHHNLGDAYFCAGKEYGLATTEYKKALQIKPGAEKPHMGLGKIHLKKQLIDKAIEEFNTALTLQPGSPEVYYRLATAYVQMGHLDMAIRYFQKSLTLSSKFILSRIGLADAFFKYGMLNDAIVHYKTVLETIPDNAEAYFNIGTIYDTKNQLDDAIACYQQALRIRPQYLKAFSHLGIIRAKTGEPDKAIELFQKALEISPYDIIVLANMAAAYELKLKNKGQDTDKESIWKAIELYHRILHLDPDNSRAEERIRELRAWSVEHRAES